MPFLNYPHFCEDGLMANTTKQELEERRWATTSPTLTRIFHETAADGETGMRNG